jgi:hypothetical protein
MSDAASFTSALPQRRLFLHRDSFVRFDPQHVSLSSRTIAAVPGNPCIPDAPLPMCIDCFDSAHGRAAPGSTVTSIYRHPSFNTVNFSEQAGRALDARVDRAPASASPCGCPCRDMRRFPSKSPTTWFSVAPDGSIIVSRKLASSEVYALDLSAE